MAAKPNKFVGDDDEADAIIAAVKRGVPKESKEEKPDQKEEEREKDK